MHQLIAGLPDLEFSLFTLSPSADQPLRYELPDNVREHRDIVISTKPKSTRKLKKKKQVFSEIAAVHRELTNAVAPSLEQTFELLPEGHFMSSEVFDDPSSWKMIVDRYTLKNPVYPFSDFFWAWKGSHDMLFTVLAAIPPEADIYHAVSTGYAGLAAVAAKIRRKKPYILTEHGLYHKEREMEIHRVKFIRGYQRDMWTNIYTSLSRISYRYADKIISLFEYNRRRQIELGAPEDRSLVIPNGIDTSLFSRVLRKEKEGFHIGLVGRVVPIKDIKTFISTAKIVSEFIPDSIFHCIGPTDEDTGYFEDCKMLVQSMKLTDRFHFTGRQDVRNCA